MRPYLLLTVTLLSGCVLHAKTPVFSEADAVPILGRHTLTLSGYTLKDGAWVPMDDASVSAVPKGNHYDVADPSADNPARIDSYYFVPLDATRYVIEAVTEGEADYAIATWDGTTLLASPLECLRLKTSLKTNLLVTFTGEACEMNPSAMKPGDLAPQAVFATLAQRAAPPSLRFVRQ